MTMHDYIFGKNAGKNPKPAKRYRLHKAGVLLASASTREEVEATAAVMGVPADIEDRDAAGVAA